MISLAFTGFLIGAGLLAAPVILHLLKLKPRTPHLYPALVFLHATAARRQNRNRLRKFIILLLRCLVLTLVTLAFAWPYVTDLAPEPEEAVVVLWDGSFSMQDENIKQHLENETVKILKRADGKHPTLAGAVTENVKWSGDFSADPDHLREWFKNNHKFYGSSSFRGAVRQADIKLKAITAKKKKIIIVSDRQFLPWENVDLHSPLSPGIELEVIMPPENRIARNTAVTLAEPLSEYFFPGQELKLKMNFRNFNPKPVSAGLAVYLGNDRVQEKKLTLPANSLSTEYIRLKTPPGTPHPLSGTVELRTEGETLLVDNIYHFSINPIAAPKVFVTPPLEKNKTDFVRISLLPPKSQDSKIQTAIRDLRPDSKFTELKDAKLVVLQDLRAYGDELTGKIDKYLDAGGNVVIVWRNSAETRKLLGHFGITVTKKENTGTQRFETLDFEHPIFKDYMQVNAGAWFDILFFGVPTLKFPPGTRILAYFDNQIPAVSECRCRNGRIFVIASELDRDHSNWPTFGSFLPFWRELLLYAGRQEQKNYSLRVSDGKLCWQEKAKVIPAEIPDAEVKSFLPLDNPGNFLVEIGRKRVIYSINVPEKESSIQLLPPGYKWRKLVSGEKIKPVKTTLKAEDKNKLQHIQNAENYWWILLLLAFILSFFEITLANRTAL
jgi:hypothetical protein